MFESLRGRDEPLMEGPGAAATIPDHTLLRRIGKGSYGEVWLARNALGTWRAVKIVRRSAFDDDRPYEREFAGIQRFEPIPRSHESQLNILQVGRAEGAFYYVMEVADEMGRGQDIDPGTYTPRNLRSELHLHGCLPAADCRRIGLALKTALGHLHKHGLVHRDIKPSNIVFVNGIPKLADIGLVGNKVDATPEEKAATYKKLAALYKSLEMEMPASMQSRMANENYSEEEPDQQNLTFDEDSSEQPNASERSSMSDETKESQQTFTEEDFRKLQQQYAEATTASQKMAEKVAALESDARRRLFTEIVTGRGGQADGSPHWFGEADKHVGLLMSLAGAFGEDSDEFKSYVEQQQTMARSMSEITKTSVGSSSPPDSGNTASGRIEAAITEKAKTGVSRAEAIQLIMREQPQLYSEYSKSMRKRDE